MAQLMENAVTGMDSYLKDFERFEQKSNQPAWLLPLRKAGMASFAEQGFPTLKDEDWRFTNVAPIANLPFKPMADSARTGPVAEALAGVAFTYPGGRFRFGPVDLVIEAGSSPVPCVTASALVSRQNRPSGISG